MQLRGCRVIEGFLIISLMDGHDESDFDGMEFPELVEIVDFFLMYRVNGLTSLAKLFPNLRVIRGKELVTDFSFIIFEMQHITVSWYYFDRNYIRLCQFDVLNLTLLAIYFFDSSFVIGLNNGNYCHQVF